MLDADQDLWTEQKSNFTLSPEDDPEKLVKEQLIKSCALKKMATLFRRWRKELNKFVDKKKTPEFIGKYENIKDHWPAFVAHKTSEKSKKMSATNRQNAAKKKLHHRTGSGGYLKARPKWSKVPSATKNQVRQRSGQFIVSGSIPLSSRSFSALAHLGRPTR